jgi:hypothetical protein
MPPLSTERRISVGAASPRAGSRDQRRPAQALGATILSLALAISACSSPYKDVPLAAPRAYSDGEEALARGDYESAATHFTAYLASGRMTYRARAFYQLARAQYNIEDYAGAEASLARLDKEFRSFGHKQVSALRGDLAYATGHRVDAILLWESAYDKSTADEREVLHPRIEEAIRFLDADEAKELAGMLTNPQIYELAIRRVESPLALAALTDGSATPPTGAAHADRATLSDGSPPGARSADDVDDPAPPMVEAAAPGLAGADALESDDAPPEPVEAGLGELGSDDAAPPAVIAALPAGAAAGAPGGEPGVYIGPRVAALLPLTGSGRAEGGRALTALRRSIDAATLLIRDTGSDPAIAVELVQQLAANRDVVALLGPMLDAEIDAVRRAPAAGLPLLPLRDRPPTEGTPDAVASLAAHAVHNLGVRRVGIISPSIERGTAFAESVSSLGATVAGTLLYDRDDTDTDAVLVAVQSWIDAGGVDAVYIPNDGDRATRIAVAARSVAPGLVLLGDAGWNDTAALAAAGTAVDGAVIAAGPSPSGDLEDTVARVAATLQRAIALGETDRQQTKQLLDGFADGASPPSLFQVVGGRPIPIPQQTQP